MKSKIWPSDSYGYPLPKIGKTQAAMLESIVNHDGYWHMGCGWIWTNYSQTTRLCVGLKKKGYLEQWNRDGMIMFLAKPCVKTFIKEISEYFR